MDKEAVLFVGPPFCGQDLYYYQHYSNTHKRVRPKDIYEADPKANLHLVILRIVELLKEWGKVVIDDDHLNAATRKSIVEGIRRKLSRVAIVCCHFFPKFGKLQCVWYLQWSMCREVIHSLQNSSSNSGDGTIHVARDLLPKHDYSNSLALTLELEDFNTVHHLELPLICDSKYQFTFPALIIEFPALVEPSGQTETLVTGSTPASVKIRDGMSRACQVWLQVYPIGHVIIMCQDEAEFETALSLKFMKSLPSPVHCFMHKGSGDSSLSDIACLQYLFCVSLYHRGTLFVYHSKGFQNTADEIGARSMRASTLVSRPRMAVSMQCADLKVPPFIPSTLFINKYKDSPLGSDNQQSVLPLHPRAIKRLENDPQCNSAAVDVNINSHVPQIKLAMCFKDKDSLESHEGLCQSALMLVTDDSVEFPETTPSILMSPHRSRSRSPMSPMGSSADSLLVKVDLSKEAACEFAVQRVIRARSTSSSSSSEDPLPTTPPPSRKTPRTLPSWMKEVEPKKRRLQIKKNTDSLVIPAISNSPRKVPQKKPGKVLTLEELVLTASEILEEEENSQTAFKDYKIEGVPETSTVSSTSADKDNQQQPARVCQTSESKAVEEVPLSLNDLFDL